MERYPMNGQGRYRGRGCPTGVNCPAGLNEGRRPGMHPYDAFPIAMCYVPYQKYTTIFELSYGLKVGTIFPDLCKPFCGKGGKCHD